MSAAGRSAGLHAVREAYANAARQLPPEYPPQPKWEELSLPLRECLISVYYQGRKASLDVLEARKP